VLSPDDVKYVEKRAVQSQGKIINKKTGDNDARDSSNMHNYLFVL
jgi:hypothetical protein